MLVNYTLIFVCLVGFAGLAVDTGILETRYLQMCSAAQAAATAAGLVLNENQPSTWAAVGAAAAANNGFTTGVNGVTVTIENPPSSGSYAGNSSAFRAILTQTVPTSFISAIVPGTLSMKAMATFVEGSNVNLSSAFNINAIYTDGSTVANGGFDTSSYSYSANALNFLNNGTSQGARFSWRGQIFYTAAPNGLNGVSNKNVTLPTGSYSQLLILAATAYGPYSNANFVVTYSDSTTTTYTSNTSDWCSPKNYAGESVVVSGAYRVHTNNGTNSLGSGPCYIYGYSINLNNTKTLSTLTLPASRNVVAFAMDVIP